jgi:hypothetical protein
MGRRWKGLAQGFSQPTPEGLNVGCEVKDEKEV